MSDIQTSTVSDAGFASTSQVGDFELTIDATDEEGPNPNAVLVADYAACFLPAVRLGAKQSGYGDLGAMAIDAEAEIDDHDDLQSISFTLYVEATVDDPAELAELGEQHCHVHTALREGLHADVTVEDGADVAV